MRELGWLAITIAVLAACDRGTNATAGECVPSAEAIVKAYAREQPKADAVVAAVSKRCVDDRWTSEARRCFANVKTFEGVEDCTYKHLTGRQDDNLDDALDGFAASTAMVMFERFTEKMCACKDGKCAQRVSDEMTKWSQEQAEKMREPARMSESETKRAAAIGERMGKCMQAAMAADMPQLAITRLDPPTGDSEGGTYVRIAGAAFTADGARNAKVYFGSRQGTVVRFASDSELIVQAPGGKPGEIVDVLVVFDPGGQQKLAGAFKFVGKP
jgi:hypothetical protein